MALRPRQELFAREYVRTGIAAVAYRNAGYEAKGETAYSCAFQVMRSKRVKDRIRELKAQAIDAAELTKDRLLGASWDLYLLAIEQGNLSVAGVMLESIPTTTTAAATVTTPWLDAGTVHAPIVMPLTPEKSHFTR